LQGKPRHFFNDGKCLSRLAALVSACSALMQLKESHSSTAIHLHNLKQTLTTLLDLLSWEIADNLQHK
jgi:hypothetical protein